MPTTTMVDFAHAVYGIANRTNSAGAAVADFTAEEARMHLPGYSEGAVDDAAFLLAASTGMGLTVGSGAAKTDRFVVQGDVAGQQTYTVRLDSAPVALTVPAADATSARTDEVYLVVADAAYDAGTVSLPRLGYRKGDAGAGAPGPDAAWKAAALLGAVAVGAAVTSITAANVTDSRTFAYAPSPLPAGTIQPFAGPSAPAGWLLCNGATVSRSTYRRLFRAIGTAFGAGDGSTTFALPDARNRVLIGSGSTYSLGSTGGAASVTLSEAQMPAHTHGDGTLTAASAGAHTHAYEEGLSNPNGNFANTGATQYLYANGTRTTSSDGAHTHDVTGATGATGGSTAVPTLPPYLGVNTIIRT